MKSVNAAFTLLNMYVLYSDRNIHYEIIMFWVFFFYIPILLLIKTNEMINYNCFEGYNFVFVKNLGQIFVVEWVEIDLFVAIIRKLTTVYWRIYIVCQLEFF